MGDKVLVPRTSGEKTVGIIIGIIPKGAVVEFPVGDTYRGKKHNFGPGRMAIKTVATKKLTLVTD